MNQKAKETGRWGEQHAVDYLVSRFYKIIARNVRTEHGEIDIIARQGQIIVFVEVKTRTSRQFGLPEESITAKKQEHMVHSAVAFLQDHSEWDDFDWRIDVIAVEKEIGDRVAVRHFENAVYG